MPRPSYKQLFEEEKKKRAKVAEETKKVMRNLRKETDNMKEQARMIIEGSDSGAREVVYLAKISELQRRVLWLEQKVADLTPGEAHHVELAERGNSGS